VRPGRRDMGFEVIANGAMVRQRLEHGCG
jgi:hypothetical protein